MIFGSGFYYLAWSVFSWLHTPILAYIHYIPFNPLLFFVEYVPFLINWTPITSKLRSEINDADNEFTVVVSMCIVYSLQGQEVTRPFPPWRTVWAHRCSVSQRGFHRHRSGLPNQQPEELLSHIHQPLAEDTAHYSPHFPEGYRRLIWVCLKIGHTLKIGIRGGQNGGLSLDFRLHYF